MAEAPLPAAQGFGQKRKSIKYSMLPFLAVNIVVVVLLFKTEIMIGLRDLSRSKNRSFDLGAAKVTVMVTSHSLDGYRKIWLLRILDYYTANEQRDLVDRVVLVWNNMEEEPPQVPPGVHILQAANSLNNRWNKTMDLIRTHAILNLDDDVLIDKKGLLCLFHAWRVNPSRLVGTFLRQTIGTKYIWESGKSLLPYSIVLPRILMVHRKFWRRTP
jgi:hypothetical protein